jgi:hypothetical protein
MSSDYSPRSGGQRRSRRRGGRGSSSNSSRPRNEGGERREGAAPKKSGGFWSKVKSLLGLAPKKAVRAERGPRSEHPTVRKAQEQRSGERTERAPRADRADRPERSERPRKESAPKPELEAPNPDAVVIPRLYIGNLAYETAESDLFDLFSKVGSVKSVELVMDRRSNRSKGFGFVEMEELETAKKAVMELHRSDFMGRQIVVSGAKSERREAAPAPEIPPIE